MRLQYSVISTVAAPTIMNTAEYKTIKYRTPTLYSPISPIEMRC